MIAPKRELHFSRPTFGPEEEQAVAEVLRSGWVVGGSKQAEFEESFAAHCGAQHAVAVSSWTAGAFLVLKCWNIGPGDEVIVPSLTFIASVNVVAHVGATPIFADIDRQTWNVSPADVERRITSRTRAIIGVDQLGMPCDLVELRRIASSRGIFLLDDAACAFGSRIGGRPIGSFADATVFSLHARKVITTGEGGMILTEDEGIADRLRRLRHQGVSLPDYKRHGAPPTVFETYNEIGYNFRMTDIQAAIGLCQLQRAADILRRRRELAQRYSQAFTEIPNIATPMIYDGVVANWQSYQVALELGGVSGRNAVLDGLYRRGIHARRGVMASHLEPPYANRVYDLPHTEYTADNTIQLPIYPDLSYDEQDYIVGAIQELVAVPHAYHPAI